MIGFIIGMLAFLGIIAFIRLIIESEAFGAFLGFIIMCFIAYHSAMFLGNLIIKAYS